MIHLFLFYLRRQERDSSIVATSIEGGGFEAIEEDHHFDFFHDEVERSVEVAEGGPPPSYESVVGASGENGL